MKLAINVVSSRSYFFLVLFLDFKAKLITRLQYDYACVGWNVVYFAAKFGMSFYEIIDFGFVW